ncbi:hypothetical protein RFI02_06550 [Acinetobacter sichuanensis]|uniref:hypothetical protein n=1 Tax=Acinetobacter sichuanensis TaxID=2136183 RepID=UPI0028106FE3|nr:hypothetical protein [Acinetobacter sichuanensis]MDQ9020760.1 hypothetical protein [Acinetobacter sichuanensis]
MKLILGSLLLLATSVQAGLVGLDNEQLGEVNGQGGADLSWTLSLNHKAVSGTALSREYECSNNLYCRLAISPNNRKDAAGNMYWLVFKQLQGTLQLDKFQLDGVPVSVGAPSAPVNRTALQLTFGIGKDSAGAETYFQPLKIRNFGYAALQIEKDADGGTNPATKGYLNNSRYPDTIASVYDRGQETGFTGLNMHGNLALAGTLKVFGCSGNTSGASRC